MLVNEENGKVRLLMRRELVLKVCCNHYIDENMEFKALLTSEKALTWCAQDYSDGDLKCELLAIRFGKVDHVSYLFTSTDLGFIISLMPFQVPFIKDV